MAWLWWVMLAGGLAIFVAVMALFVVALLRPGLVAALSPKAWIIGGGVLFPIPVLALLVQYALFQGEHLIHHAGARGPDGGDVPVMRIEAHAWQWLWEFRYPDMPGAQATIGTLHIPARRPVEIIVTSHDVIHSFWVPRLGGKVDATPGHETRVRLLADRPGSFGGLCAEYCGRDHAFMTFRVLAHEPDDYPGALTSQETASAQAGGEMPATPETRTAP